MPALLMPKGELALCRRGDDGDDSAPKPSQIMRLNLAQGTLDELVQSLRNDQKARLRLGKHPAVQYGSKSHSLHVGPQGHRSELYAPATSSTDNGSLYFSGLLSHSLEVQKAKEATAASDDALANLEQSLSAFERGKESKKTPLITTIGEMKALKAGDNRSATGKEAASLTRMSRSKIDVEKERFFNNNAASRSSPASPALLASRSPIPNSAVTPTSAPTPLPQNKDKIRLDALRVPLIHLLATRPATAKSLAQRTRSTQGDCLVLLQKYGTEHKSDREKFDLKDKSYKDLDVWTFPYPSQEDRQAAIDNAISAFDRMRVSRQDKLWQTLLPKRERGKGKVLSRLNLSAGPVPKPVTPRLPAPSSEEQPKGGYGTGNESEPPASGKLTSNMAASDGGKKEKKSPRDNKSAATKQAPKETPKKPKSTTLTGKVTKKADKDKRDTKFKSAEFVVDSDEDTEMVDVTPAKSPSRDAAKDTREQQSTATADQPTAKKTPPEKTSKEEQGEQHRRPPGKSQSSSKTVPSSTAPAKATNGTSPQKPSPLGSSPPTNASDFEAAPRSSITTQSSSSSSPLISQLPKHRAGTNQPAPDRNNDNSSSVRPRQQSAKRKADAHPEVAESRPRANTSSTSRQHGTSYGLGISNTNGHLPEPKRRRASSPSSAGSSTGSASPPISHEILRQRLRDKSRQFKQYYARYRTLHEELSNHPDPPRNQLEKLERQHVRLEKMKQEIWDEDRKLRIG